MFNFNEVVSETASNTAPNACEGSPAALQRPHTGLAFSAVRLARQPQLDQHAVSHSRVFSSLNRELDCCSGEVMLLNASVCSFEVEWLLLALRCCLIELEGRLQGRDPLHCYMHGVGID